MNWIKIFLVIRKIVESEKYFIHETAIVEDGVEIGENSNIWHYCHVRKLSKIGSNVSLGKDVFVDSNVLIGNGSRIQNSVSLYDGVKVMDWVFVGPNVSFTNDKNPRAGSKTWVKSETILNNGCSIGAGSIVLSEVTIGSFALIGAASIITSDVQPFSLVYGVPAKEVAKVCACGVSRLALDVKPSSYIASCCKGNLRAEVYELAKKEIKKLS